MKSRKELMDEYIKEDGEKIFELFYSLIKGEADINKLSEEEKIISKCIQNQCTAENGNCYELYCSLKKIRNSKTKEKMINLYEIILKTLCKELFFDALRLGFVLKNILI